MLKETITAIAAFNTDKKSTSSASTAEAYNNDVKKFYAIVGKDTKLEDINYKHLEKFINNLTSVQNLQIRTIHRSVSGVKSFFKFCAMKGYLLAYPDFAKAKPMKPLIKNIPRYLEVAEVNTLIEAVKKGKKAQALRNIAIIETMFSCGLRVSEVVNLKLEDVSTRRRIMTVNGRAIPFNEALASKIRKYLAQRKKQVNAEGSDILFVNRRGNKLSRVMIFTIIKALSEETGIKDINPSTLRHSFAIHLLANGAQLHIVTELLGHDSIITTLMMYSDVIVPKSATELLNK